MQHTEARAGVPIDRESLHPGCPTGGNLEWHAFSVVNVWRLLDRRTRRPKVMLVPRVAAVPRSTESRPLVRNENRAEPNHNHSGGREGRPIVSSRGRKGRPISHGKGRPAGPVPRAHVLAPSLALALRPPSKGRPVDPSHGSDHESAHVRRAARPPAVTTSQPPRAAGVGVPSRKSPSHVRRYHCGQHPPNGCRTWPICRLRLARIANPGHAPGVCTVWLRVGAVGGGPGLRSDGEAIDAQRGWSRSLCGP